MTVVAGADLEVRIEFERTIEAPIEAVFAAVLHEVGPGFVGEDGESIGLQLEAFPGGRWYRNLGEGVGHLWGHVQAIKPSTLLELTGPLFMSLPVNNNVQYRLRREGGVTILTFAHTGFGPIPEDYRDGMSQGWQDHMDQIAKRATA